MIISLNNNFKRNMYIKNLRHDNVVKLYEIIQDVDKIVLIFEYADMDLKMYVDKEKGIYNNRKN